MKVAVLDDWSGTARQMADWSNAGDVTFFGEPIPAVALPQKLAPFDAICLMRERTAVTADLIAALPNLKLIVTTGPRNASIDIKAAQARGITVCGTQSRKTTTSELTLGMILTQCRGLVAESARIEAGGFQGPPGRDLADLRVGLVGLGNVGQQVATLAKAFGSTVSAWSPNLTQDRAAAAGVGYAQALTELAAQSDVLSIHMVMAEATRDLIGRAALAALPRGAIVVNTSRAGLLDRAALFDWLADDPTAQAAIDVFEAEPLAPDDPWRKARTRFGTRLLLTPHLGYATEATWRLFYTQTVEAIGAYRAGSPIRVIEG
ncbi:Glycerate dehydrogenase [Rhodobacteraceae bacterium THAF1]|nr:Glycerate dehydrogenase [Palleronia sp. THAF1]VDC27909.1 Glycerate dehydrogenase [Rhodobacteraceae bacterium THAF1]